MFCCISKYISLSPPVLLSHLRIFVVVSPQQVSLACTWPGRSSCSCSLAHPSKTSPTSNVLTLRQSINMQGGAKEASATCPVGKKYKRRKFPSIWSNAVVAYYLLLDSQNIESLNTSPLRMLPTPLLALTASLLIPRIAASSTPICESSTQGYATSDITTLYKDFCGILEKSNFTSDVQLYGTFMVSFSFTSANSSNICDLSNCLSSYSSLVQSCKHTYPL